MDVRRQVRAKLAQGKSDAFEWLAERRLVPCADRVTPFIVLGMGRTGSNLLASMLRAHPNAVCFGELFNHGERWGYPDYRHTRSQARDRDSDPAGFIRDNVIGRPQPRRVRAVGFKLFYYHTDAWPAIEALGLRVVHLKRRNLLELVTSMTRALRSGTWAGPTADQPLRLEAESLRRAFERIEDWWQEFDARFPDALELTYEQLSSRPEDAMGRVCEHLDLPPAPPRSDMRKQESRPMRERIANYRELQAEFSDTRWSGLFQ